MKKKLNILFLVFILICIIYIFFAFFKPKLIETYVGNLRVANEIDEKRATKYALKKFCEMGGYKWVQGAEEFTYDCKHTKETCQRESVYPTPKTEDAIARYYEWRDNKSPEYKYYANEDKAYEIATNLSGGSASEPLTDPDGICLIGNEAYRKFCEDETLRYDPNDGNCYTTKQYCNNRLLAFCNGDCYQPPGTDITSKVFGTTVARVLGAAEFATAQAICDATASNK